MSEVQRRQVRAVSARPAPVVRPQSGKNRKVQVKTELIENLYGSQIPAIGYLSQKNRINSLKANEHELGHSDINKLLPRPEKIIKEKEELFEENLYLKQEVHKLKDELIKSKTKIEALNTKNQKYTKQFNREFEKKIYWNGNNTYLISGIKAQYEKLKEEFDQREQECQVLKKELIESRTPEFKIYSENLQEENKKLYERIQKMTEISEQVLFESGNVHSIPESVYNDLESKKERVEEKLREKQHDLKVSNDLNKEYGKKIEFLEKLIIEKDNVQYHATKKAKKLEREKNVCDSRIKELEMKSQDATKVYEAKVEKLKILEEKRFKGEKEVFERALNEKEERIQKLEKEVAYLSTLLTYWKPLDELNKDYADSIYDDENPQKYLKPEQETKKELKEDTLGQNQSKVELQKPRKASGSSNLGSEIILKKSLSINNDMKETFKSEEERLSRVQQTADKKHNEEAEKKRKVEFKEVESIGEYLRYRFLGLRLELDSIRKYFDYENVEKNPEARFILEAEKNEESVEEKSWQEEYITMKEVKHTLQQYPFELTDKDAYTLSRYLIEDSNNEHVYVDENNEHHRSIVKSIIKAIVGHYEVLDGERQIEVESECKVMIEKYQSNLISALSAMAGTGFISRKKFLELLNSLGIELSEEGRDFLVCKMLLKSESLEKLGYMLVFE